MRPTPLQMALVPGYLLAPSRLYTAPDGRVYADFPPQLGAPGGMVGVSVICLGGGIPSRFGQSASVEFSGGTPETTPQALILFLGVARTPYVVGMNWPGTGTAQASIPVNDGIRGPGLALTDHGTVNGGSTVSHSATGRWTADLAGATDPTAAVQLPAGGTLQVSRDGDFSGRLVLDAEITQFLQDQRTQLNILLGRVAVLEAAVGIINPPTVTFPNPAGYTLAASAITVSSDAE